MTEPVEFEKLALAALAAAGIVMFGVCYAVFYGLGRLNGKRKWRVVGHYAYLGVALATLVLTWSLQLDGAWLLLVAVLLVGYFFAPRAIWSLSVATHEPTHDELE